MGEPEDIGTDQPDAAHDVLAAEMFAMPGVDPALHHHGPVLLPDDPTGIQEPHDILAAEEFPMPAPRSGVVGAVFTRGSEHGRRLAFLVAGFLLAVLLLGRRRR